MYSAIAIRSALVTASHLTRTPAARFRRDVVDGCSHFRHDLLVRNADSRGFVRLSQSFLYLRTKPAVMGGSFVRTFHRLRSVRARCSGHRLVRVSVGGIDLNRRDPDLAEEPNRPAEVNEPPQLLGAGGDQHAIVAF